VPSVWPQGTIICGAPYRVLAKPRLAGGIDGEACFRAKEVLIPRLEWVEHATAWVTPCRYSDVGTSLCSRTAHTHVPTASAPVAHSQWHAVAARLSARTSIFGACAVVAHVVMFLRHAAEVAALVVELLRSRLRGKGIWALVLRPRQVDARAIRAVCLAEVAFAVIDVAARVHFHRRRHRVGLVPNAHLRTCAIQPVGAAVRCQAGVPSGGCNVHTGRAGVDPVHVQHEPK
jgi:hypothetical protein